MDNYKIDFVIPSGVTGPMGESSFQNLESMIFVEYNDTSTAGFLSPINITYIPSNSNIYRIVNDEIEIIHQGYYEFKIYGVIKKNAISNGTNIMLKTNNGINDDRLYFRLPADENEMYFSYSKIRRFPELRRVQILFSKNSDSGASIQNVRLEIKRLPFEMI